MHHRTERYIIALAFGGSGDVAWRSLPVHGKGRHKCYGETMMRPLTNKERDFIAQIGEKLGGSEGAQLLADAKNASAISATVDSSRIQFEIPGYERPKYKGQRRYGVEGKMLDQDGAELSVLLHADENGRLFELEFIRWGEGDLINPDWNTLKLY